MKKNIFIIIFSLVVFLTGTGKALAASYDVDLSCEYMVVNEKQEIGFKTSDGTFPSIIVYAHTDGRTRIFTNIQNIVISGNAAFGADQKLNIEINDDSFHALSANNYVTADGKIDCHQVPNIYVSLEHTWGWGDTLSLLTGGVVTGGFLNIIGISWETWLGYGVYMKLLVTNPGADTDNYMNYTFNMINESPYEPGKPMELTEVTCGALLDGDFGALLRQAMNFIRYLFPVVLILLTILDFVKVIASQDQDQVKKAVTRFGKRLIIVIVVFFVPTVLMYLFEILGTSTCYL